MTSTDMTKKRITFFYLTLWFWSSILQISKRRAELTLAAYACVFLHQCIKFFKLLCRYFKNPMQSRNEPFHRQIKLWYVILKMNKNNSYLGTTFVHFWTFSWYTCQITVRFEMAMIMRIVIVALWLNLRTVKKKMVLPIFQLFEQFVD